MGHGFSVVKHFPASSYTIKSDGTDRTPLPAGVGGGRLSYSPDGTKFLSARSAGGAADIFMTNLDGSGLTDLTNTPGVLESEPDWQPYFGPRRRDYKNPAKFCKAEREFLGDASFNASYGGGASAYGKCVSQSH